MDFEVADTTRPVEPEFVAVVLAGFGNELVPLTSDNGDEPCPKALLPIANKPMLDYPLTWLEQSGVRDVLLICPTSHRSAISHHINSDSTSAAFSSLRIDLQTYDETQDLSAGTCSLLRHFSHRIKHDFILLPCDFVPPTTLSLATILNRFRTESASDGTIATTCWFENVTEKSTTDEWDAPNTRVPIIWDDASSTLLYVDTEDDVDRNGEEFEFRMSMLSSHGRAKLSSSFQDSHVYVCRRSVLDVLQQKVHVESFREDFIPWLCKPQYQRKKREKYGHALAGVTSAASQTIALKHSTLNIAPASRPYNFSSTPTSPDEEDDDRQMTSASLRVAIVLHRAAAGHAARANNLRVFLDLNRRALSSPTYSYALPSEPERRSLIDPKAQISSDSMIGDSSRVEERTNVKRSVIGKHCIIGKMAKITGCVLLDHCVVGDMAKLDGCILGKNTKVGSKAELSKCVTQPGYEVDAGQVFKNEKLEVSDWAAAATDSSDDEAANVDGDHSDSDSET